MEGYYAGVTVELPVTFEGHDYDADRNRNSVWLGQRVGVAPYIRWRHYYLDGPLAPNPNIRLNDFGLGISLRIQFVSDIP